ncbi:MAG: hypothetical protein J6W35_03870 [Eubacterium sp.]|nr:hypothetical protein [Eubacterium sp.]
MKKLFSKTLAVAISLAMVVALGAGIYFTKDTQAASYLGSAGWAFEQGGCYSSAQETEWGNVGYISSVAMATNGETINSWERGMYNTQTQTASADTGAAITIENNGWDAQWKEVTGYPTVRINPWSIQAMAKFNGMNYDHNYKVTFKAKATKKKYCYVNFNTVVDGHEMSPYDNVEGALTGDEQVIVLGTQEKEFTYTFPNYVGGHELTVDFMLGSFTQDGDGNVYDYAGNALPQCEGEETQWKNGTVTFSDVKVEDLDPDKPTDPTEPPLYTTTAPAPATTVAPQPTQAPTVKPAPAVKTLAKVTGVKVKSVKKKTIKVSWKKTANAKSYQIKVGNKTYKATKTSKKIKNKKFKKGKKVKVKVRAMAAGYKTGAWSKTVKKKLTK